MIQVQAEIDVVNGGRAGPEGLMVWYFSVEGGLKYEESWDCSGSPESMKAYIQAMKQLNEASTSGVVSADEEDDEDVETREGKKADCPPFDVKRIECEGECKGKGKGNSKACKCCIKGLKDKCKNKKNKCKKSFCLNTCFKGKKDQGCREQCCKKMCRDDVFSASNNKPKCKNVCNN